MSTPSLSRLWPIVGAVALLATPGCATKRTSLQVLRPADVMLPAHVRTLAVIDRSKASGIAEGALGVLEGALTGEALGADMAGRQEAIRSTATRLQSSPRFDAVLPVVDGKTAESSLFDSTMSWEAARYLCEQAGCDAIVALESFDSDSHYDHSVRTEKREDDKGKVIKKIIHRAARDTAVTASWRVYDVSDKQVRDDLRALRISRTWSHEGSTEAAAMRELPSQFETITLVGHDIGMKYATRIAPVYVMVSRRYYVKGHETLKDAKDYVMAGDWESAGELWMTLAEHSNAEVRGRAEYNLALTSEVGGYLDDALEWAQRAAVDLDNKKSREYVAAIRGRLEQQERLMQQMGQPQDETLY